MAHVYSATIETKPSNSLNHQSNTREITIVTDTFQNAFAIARTQCNNNEEVTYVYLMRRDPYIDANAVGDSD